MHPICVNHRLADREDCNAQIQLNLWEGLQAYLLKIRVRTAEGHVVNLQTIRNIEQVVWEWHDLEETGGNILKVGFCHRIEKPSCPQPQKVGGRRGMTQTKMIIATEALRALKLLYFLYKT